MRLQLNILLTLTTDTPPRSIPIAWFLSLSDKRAIMKAINFRCELHYTDTEHMYSAFHNFLSVTVQSARGLRAKLKIYAWLRIIDNSRTRLNMCVG